MPDAFPATALSPVLEPVFLAESLSGKQLIHGALALPASGATFDVFNPATGGVAGKAAAGEARDVAAAVAAAKAAFPAWAGKSARERGKILQEAARLLQQHAEELARLMTLETGKALRTESRVEANNFADVFAFFAGLAPELKGETVPFNPKILTMTVREPHGVVAAVLPWNVPLMLMAHKVAPALVAGNTVVVKSAEEAPLCVLRAGQLLSSLLPPGVLNILSGDGPNCGGPLVSHPDVAKVSFTGSVETGKIIAKIAAEKLIPVTLELGGKSPLVILADADLEAAVEGAFVGMRFTRQGQSCTAASRIYVQEGIFDRFVAAFKARIERLVIGDPFDEKTDIGAIISQGQFAKVQEYIRHGESEKGAVAHRCGQLPTDPALAKGLYLQPTLFTGLAQESRLVREEIFGPVTCLLPFKQFEDGIAMANDSRYGLAAAIFTKDLRQGLRGAQMLEAGFVQVNQYIVFQPGTSFGGVKSSGLGHEATLEAMCEHYTRKRTILVNLA